ncbi:MAG: hypothetical protein ACE5I3_06575 [Phycisphaerae bacterium]
MKWLASLLAVAVPVAAAQPITPIYFWELEYSLADLSAQPSTDDLVQGFPETATPGILSDEVINEGLNNGMFGIIDEANGVYSFLMVSGLCLEMIEGLPSEGFLPNSPGCPGCPGNVGQFVDGELNGYQDGILRDYARAALSVRFGFSMPTDIGTLRVIGGNWDRNGRTFHHYDVWASIDGLGDMGSFFAVALGVRTGDFTWINNGLWEASLTEVHDFDSKYLVQGATDLRIVFYCVDNTQGRFQDQWQGNFNEDPGYQTACPDTEPEDTDGFRKAFVGSIIRETDVFAPGVETPWGDIDYDDDTDLVDAAAFQRCFASSTTSGGCFRFDFNEDAVIAIDDFTTFASMMTGPN